MPLFSLQSQHQLWCVAAYVRVCVFCAVLLCGCVLL